jgi:hypothetical protein
MFILHTKYDFLLNIKITYKMVAYFNVLKKDSLITT